MNIVLIGYQGAGKTTLAKLVSDKYNLNFIDTDTLLLQASNYKTIRSLYADIGEHKFRELESLVITDLMCKNSIIATGGGTVLQEYNVKLLQRLGPLVYLFASNELLISRLGVLPPGYGVRDKIYTAIADYKFNAETALKSVSELIEGHCG